MNLVEPTAEDIDAIAERWYASARSVESYDDLNELAYEVGEIHEDVFRSRLEDEATGFVTLREGRHPSRKHSTISGLSTSRSTKRIAIVATARRPSSV